MRFPSRIFVANFHIFRKQCKKSFVLNVNTLEFVKSWHFFKHHAVADIKRKNVSLCWVLFASKRPVLYLKCKGNEKSTVQAAALRWSML